MMAAKTSTPNRAEAVANVQAAIEACHDECEVASLDEVLEDLTQLKIALGFAHQALVDAGVIVPEAKEG